jgi:hypothetical protein
MFCHYAEGRVLFIIMLSVVMLSVVAPYQRHLHSIQKSKTFFLIGTQFNKTFIGLNY